MAPPAPLTVQQVFEDYAPYVLRSLHYLRVADADVQDVAQGVFLVVHRKLDEFAGRSSVRTWLYAICLRVASDYRRSAKVRRETPIRASHEVSVPPGQEESLDRLGARAALARLLEPLDEKKRQVFVLYEIEELPMNEVAAAVGCPLKTAYSRLHAARREVSELAGKMRRTHE